MIRRQKWTSECNLLDEVVILPISRLQSSGKIISPHNEASYEMPIYDRDDLIKTQMTITFKIFFLRGCASCVRALRPLLLNSYTTVITMYSGQHFVFVFSVKNFVK